MSERRIISCLYRKYFELCKSKEQYLGRGFLKVNSRFAVFSTSLYLFYLTLTKTGMEYDRANFYSIIARIVLTETSMAVAHFSHYNYRYGLH